MDRVAGRGRKLDQKRAERNMTQLWGPRKKER